MNLVLNKESDCVLAILFRRPVLGIGKRRIADRIGDDATLQLSRHLLMSALEDAEYWPGPVVLSPSNEDDVSWAKKQLDRSADAIAQCSGNLGHRINALDELIRAQGFRRVIYIGSDAPVLDADYFVQARRALKINDIVLGPAEDGGVTLMGASRPWPDLAGLPWSSAELGAALEQTCRQHGLNISLLEQRFDVDVDQDLRKLFSSLAEDRRPARLNLLNWLEQMKLHLS